MDDLTYISEKTCQICNINKDIIKNAFNHIEAVNDGETSNIQDWNLNIKRINKYNNGDYKEFIDEYNAHWNCIPKVNQINYSERIKKNIEKLNNKEFKNEIINLKENNEIDRWDRDNEIKSLNFIIYDENKKHNEDIEKLKNFINSIIKENTENIESKNNEVNLLNEDIESKDSKINSLNDSIDKLKYENKRNKEIIIEQEEIIKQLLEQLEIKNKSIFEKLF